MPSSNKQPPTDATPLDERSYALRRQIVRTLAAGNRGHLGSAFSLVEILRVLYDDVLRYDAGNSAWKERDRFILSKGHGCLALYAMLAEKGFFAEDELWRFCRDDGILGGHPEAGKVPGIEASTGSLGHGLSIGVGLALSARHDRAKHRVFVVMGDGECNEGSVWEAALCAAKHGLTNLTALIDYNKQQSYATTYEVLDLEPLADKWRAFGFAVAEVNGHSLAELKATFARLPLESDRPSMIICHTIKGKGLPQAENNLQWHHKNRIAADEVESVLAALRGS